MLAESQARNDQLKAENENLKKSSRPSDALVIGTNLVFQKKTRQDLVGKSLKLKVPADAITLHIATREVKVNKSGNVYVWATGWIDTSKLDIAGATGEAKPADKVTKSLAEKVTK
jgi:hypothetical protein